MATSDVAAGLSPFKLIGLTSSGTGEADISGGPKGLTGVIGIEVTDGTVLTGNESATTDGLYEITGRSGTTASKVLYFIL